MKMKKCPVTGQWSVEQKPRFIGQNKEQNSKFRGFQFGSAKQDVIIYAKTMTEAHDMAKNHYGSNPDSVSVVLVQSATN